MYDTIMEDEEILVDTFLNDRLKGRAEIVSEVYKSSRVYAEEEQMYSFNIRYKDGTEYIVSANVRKKPKRGMKK